MIRDPRDVALCTARIACTPAFRKHHPQPFSTAREFLDYHLASLIRAWSQHVREHVHHGYGADVNFVFYERLIDSPGRMISDLQAYLGARAGVEKVERQAGRSGFAPDSTYDTPNLMEGGWGSWKTDLTNFQIQSVAQMAGDLMGVLGYPLERETAAEWDSSSLTIEVLNEFIQSMV